jgi:hypothetical protein
MQRVQRGSHSDFIKGFPKKNSIFLYDAKSNKHAVIQEELIISIQQQLSE